MPETEKHRGCRPNVARSLGHPGILTREHNVLNLIEPVQSPFQLPLLSALYHRGNS